MHTKMSEIYKTFIPNHNRMFILLTKEGMNNERKRESERVRNRLQRLLLLWEDVFGLQ